MEVIYVWPAGTAIRFEGNSDTGFSIVESDGSKRAATPIEKRSILREQLASRILNEDVLCCDSMLVENLMAAVNVEGLSPDLVTEWDRDKVVNYRVDPSDWTLEECKAWLDEQGFDLPDPNPWAMDTEELRTVVATARGVDKNEGEAWPETDDALRSEVIAYYNSEEDPDGDCLSEWRDAVRDEAENREVFEWWRVSKYLGQKLVYIGEPVMVNSYGCWYGRTCTGQSMQIDGTPQKVAELILG